MKLDSMKEGVGSLWASLGEGWQHLRQSAANALTQFRTDAGASLPARKDVDDATYMPTRSWSMLGGDVFEDDRQLIVKLEVPGMEKKDFTIEVLDDALVVSGEKHFQEESSEGRWQVLQCAYGSFRREIPLSTPVLLDEAKATYTNGVLRIVLPKAEPGPPRRKVISIN